MSRLYGDKASFYDMINKNKNYEMEVKYVNNQFERYCINMDRTVCDMGCGTGNHIKYLLGFNYKIYGVDISSEILSIAKEKVSDEKKCMLINSDDTNVLLPEKVSMIISMFSSFCHKLTEEEALNALMNYRANIIKGGLLIIDIINYERFFELYNNRIFDRVHVHNQFSCKSNVSIIDGNKISWEKCYEIFENNSKFNDKFLYKVYKADEIKMYMEKARFEFIGMDTGFNELDSNRKILKAIAI